MNTHDPAVDPPGAVSDQNGEEAQSGLRKDGTHPEPRTHETEEERRDDADPGAQRTPPDSRRPAV